MAEKTKKKKTATSPKKALKTSTPSRKRSVIVKNNSEKPINIYIAENSLDNYRSPHLLNLKYARFIERVKPVKNNPVKSLTYQELPAGDLLEKTGIFKLIDLENSEILRGSRSVYKKIRGLFTETVRPTNLSIKLKHKTIDAEPSLWEETALGDLLSFICLNLLKIINKFSNLKHDKHSFFWKNFLSAFKQKLQPSRTEKTLFYKDTTIQFKLKPIPPVTVKEEWEEVDDIDEADSRVPRLIKLRPKFNLKFTRPTLAVLINSFVLFAILGLIIILPIKTVNYFHQLEQAKGTVLGEAETALINLNYAQAELFDWNFEEAQNYFIGAKEHFLAGQSALNNIQSVLTVLAEKIPFNNTYKSGKNLIDLGANIALAGESLSAGVKSLANGEAGAVADRITAFQAKNNVAIGALLAAQNNLEKINLTDLPTENQTKFNLLKEYLSPAITVLKQAQAAADFAGGFLGKNEIKRYLVVFQNDNELRATGGFIGSFALLDVKNGAIENITLPAGGTYDVRAGLRELIAAPKPLQLINPRWEMQDANWWPNWPTSAQKIMWFYEKSQGPTVDGVIAINSDWLGEVLKVTGPIDLTSYKKTVTADNFEDLIQNEVEIERDNIKEPKKILADLAPIILEKIFNAEAKELPKLITAVGQGLNNKDILIFLRDQKLNDFIVANNWDGKIKETDGDYLGVVATNIGGGKTDNVIKQNIYHQATINQSGEIVDRLIIERHHFGPIETSFTNQTNRSYLRIYTPLGSKLISAAGFISAPESKLQNLEDYLKADLNLTEENQATIDLATNLRTYTEDGKTVFAGWLETKPGETSEVALTYSLPLILKFGRYSVSTKNQENYYYSLVAQKQAGSNDDSITAEIIYPDNIQPLVTYPQNITTADNRLTSNRQLSSDLLFFSYFENK